MFKQNAGDLPQNYHHLWKLYLFTGTVGCVKKVHDNNDGKMDFQILSRLTLTLVSKKLRVNQQEICM